MNGWFITLIILQAIGLGIHTARHGQKSENTYNFWVKLIASGIVLTLIYMAVKTGF